jgi:hypothetical protein
MSASSARDQPAAPSLREWHNSDIVSTLLNGNAFLADIWANP